MEALLRPTKASSSIRNFITDNVKRLDPTGADKTITSFLNKYGGGSGGDDDNDRNNKDPLFQYYRSKVCSKQPPKDLLAWCRDERAFQVPPGDELIVTVMLLMIPPLDCPSTEGISPLLFCFCLGKSILICFYRETAKLL